LAFVLQLPPALKKGDVISEQEKHKFVDDMYREIGIEKGRLKYKIGLIFYLVGGTLGWILSYIQIVSI
jgi:hypothetical protein